MNRGRVVKLDLTVSSSSGRPICSISSRVRLIIVEPVVHTIPPISIRCHRAPKL
jgi:hypothetical protein